MSIKNQKFKSVKYPDIFQEKSLSLESKAFLYLLRFSEIPHEREFIYRCSKESPKEIDILIDELVLAGFIEEGEL